MSENIRDFWKRQNLEFDSFKKGIAWTKRHLKLDDLRRVSNENYMVNANTALVAYRKYLTAQETIRKKRVARAAEMNKQKISPKITQGDN